MYKLYMYITLRYCCAIEYNFCEQEWASWAGEPRPVADQQDLESAP